MAAVIAIMYRMAAFCACRGRKYGKIYLSVSSFCQLVFGTKRFLSGTGWEGICYQHPSRFVLQQTKCDKSGFGLAAAFDKDVMAVQSTSNHFLIFLPSLFWITIISSLRNPRLQKSNFQDISYSILSSILVRKKLLTYYDLT